MIEGINALLVAICVGESPLVVAALGRDESTPLEMFVALADHYLREERRLLLFVLFRDHVNETLRYLMRHFCNINWFAHSRLMPQILHATIPAGIRTAPTAHDRAWPIQANVQSPFCLRRAGSLTAPALCFSGRIKVETILSPD